MTTDPQRGPGRPAVEDSRRLKSRKIQFSDHQWASLQAAARARGVSVARLIRDAVGRDLEWDGAGG